MAIYLTDEGRQQWTDALRSGEYDQTTGVLCDSIGYCCLGVLAEVMSAWDDDGPYSVQGDTQMLSIDWEEIRKDKRQISPELLARFNDSHVTFDKIAWLIDEVVWNENITPQILIDIGFAQSFRLLILSRIGSLNYERRRHPGRKSRLTIHELGNMVSEGMPVETIMWIRDFLLAFARPYKPDYGSI